MRILLSVVAACVLLGACSTRHMRPRDDAEVFRADGPQASVPERPVLR